MPNVKLIDTHTHLEDIEDLSEAMKRAENAGISSIIAVASDYESNKRVLEISCKYGNVQVYPALGLHPWGLQTSKINPTMSFIEKNIHKAVAIGEVGLDFWSKEARKDPKTREAQKDVFKSLLELAKKYAKPVLIHARGAWEDSFNLIREAQISKAVFHWFSGPLEVLDKILDSGYLISATPALEYSKSHQRAIIKAPLESLFLETDCPVEYQGIRSEPADLLRTLKAVAKLKGKKIEEVARITTENSLRFFNLD
ncbi:MAG: TatD family hydrolase [Pseudomonadota bacterium]